MMCFAKAITSSYVPMGAVAISKKVQTPKHPYKLQTPNRKQLTLHSLYIAKGPKPQSLISHP